MTARATPTVDALAEPDSDTARLYQEGMIAGVIGAIAVAVWFLLLDTAAGRPLYTPTVLGTAIFRRSALASPETLSVSLEMVGMFTWVHMLVFAALGGIASRLLGMVERNPSWGFGLLLFAVVFEFGFLAAALVFATPVLRLIPWPSVLVANLLAAAAMSAYFWWRHPRLVVRP
jgi:hypothetical protein